MENDTFTFTLSLHDARNIVQALRNEAFQLTQESDRACEKGALEYGTFLWNETATLNNLADYIDLELPE